MLSKEGAHQVKAKFKLLRLDFLLPAFHQAVGKLKREEEQVELKLEE